MNPGSCYSELETLAMMSDDNDNVVVSPVTFLVALFVPFALYAMSRIRERFEIAEWSVPNACHSKGIHWNTITCVSLLLYVMSRVLLLRLRAVFLNWNVLACVCVCV
jgi:hypothetical protein